MIDTFDPAVRDFLTGRIWLRLHTPFSTETIDAHILSQHIKPLPGITSIKTFANRAHHFCNRCENDNQSRFTTFDCAKCNGPCTYCRHCLKMGRVSTCTELITWNGELPTYLTTHSLAWQGILTPRQQQASDELTNSTTKGIPHLIHAVCGAGKPKFYSLLFTNYYLKANVYVSRPLASTSSLNSNRVCAQHSRKLQSQHYTEARNRRRQLLNLFWQQHISSIDFVTHSMPSSSMKPTHFLIQQTKRYEEPSKKQ